MPRQDVPYGGAICRLRERIAEIFDKLGEKLHTINGVPGDGDGNVKIVSGSSAVVISNDPTQNEIAVSLDTSQLPAAAVSSVNGQTGAVALDAGDIPTVGGSGDVQADLQDLASDISGNTAAINAEVLARQGADSTLQTNINTLSASLPSAAAAAVASDPTVAQLVTDMAGKVDLTDVTAVETPDTIAKRNGSGRLVAADPASGATDKTLVTANWVSQTGAGRPNNLIHDSGNETINGFKKHTSNVAVEAVNPRIYTTDTREFSTFNNANIIGGFSIEGMHNNTPQRFVGDEVRISGFGVVGGVERMMWTYCIMPDDSVKYVILRVRMNPQTGKAQLMFGNTIIAEVNL